jgi:Competence protein CoiA-like family
MGYAVYRGEQRIVSYDYLDREAWHQLRKQAHELYFPCCQARVILKTSQRGWPFFAHPPGTACEYATTAPESPQHHQLKTAVANHINNIDGWTAQIEPRLPSGSIPDVYATHRDRRQAGVEIQLASQSTDTYINRSRRILEDQVLPIWVVDGYQPVFNQFKLAWFQITHGLWGLTNPAMPSQPLQLTGCTTQWGESQTSSLGDYLTMALAAPEWPWLGAALPPPTRPADRPAPTWPAAVQAGIAEINRQARDAAPVDRGEAIRALYARSNAAAALLRDVPLPPEEKPAHRYRPYTSRPTDDQQQVNTTRTTPPRRGR